MAGYIISLNSEESLKECIEKGLYATLLSNPKNKRWLTPHEGTFADYYGMKEGDNIYFFIKRKIYGIGVLVNHNGDCKYLNYPEADLPNVYDYDEIKDNMIMNREEDLTKRCFCIFKPYPKFFEHGVDMDEVLLSNPSKFRMLRAFWKLSFIKIDDEENKALRDVILKVNEEYIFDEGHEIIHNTDLQRTLLEKVNDDYRMTHTNIISSCQKDSKIGHEMAIEAALMDILSNDRNNILGHWDYISHQVVASPFKPIDYMDKMDVFGYRYIPGYDTISKYLVIEIKKDNASKEVVDQVMKYVDWINQEYTYGNYGMIEAFVVAAGYDDDVLEYRNNIAVRNYMQGRRPVTNKIWTCLRLIKYRYENGKIKFEEVVE